MRQRFARQLDLGQAPIEDVPIPLKSRDEWPPRVARASVDLSDARDQ